MPDTHRVTLVIPVHNGAGSLEALFADIEKLLGADVVFVDDGSTDGSAGLLLSFAEKHPHVRVIVHEKNIGVTKARRSAVMTVTTPYIMFADCDDRLPVPDAPVRLADAMDAGGYDLIMFDTDIVFDPSVPEGSYKENLRKNLRFEKQLPAGADYNRLMFVEQTMNGPLLWNKIYRTAPVRWANEQLEGAVIPLGQDQITIFLILTQVSSIGTCENSFFYQYHVGGGVSTRPFETPERLRLLAHQADGWHFLEKILRQQGLWEACSESWNAVYAKFCSGMLTNWAACPDAAFRKELLRELPEIWGADLVRSLLPEILLERVAQLEEERNALRESERRLLSSPRWRIGGAALWLPKKIRGLLRR